ncbi:MAG: hypothetical protein JXA60_00795 [Candidatus Coatesbacteria bacterium]|nr:hypothetical protein [Candidatus Coatesbacteria bacterium]
MDGWQEFSWGMNYNIVLDLIRRERDDIQVSYILCNDRSIAFSKEEFAKQPLSIGYFQFEDQQLYAVDFIFKKRDNEDDVISSYKKLSFLIDFKIGKGQVIYEGKERRKGKRAEIITQVDIPDYYGDEFFIKVWTVGRTHIILSYALYGKHMLQIYLRYLDKYHSFHPPEEFKDLYEKIEGNGYIRKNEL